MNNKNLELLAPGGDIDSIKAAIIAGADAVYCGLDKFNARNRAENITFDNLQGLLRLAHEHNCELFLTLNIIIVESEFPALITLLNKLVNTDIDGVIVQDFGLLYILSKYFPTLKVHASTQLTTHNDGQIKFLKELSVTRVNLSRELNLAEITDLARTGHDNNILTEVFVHGSNCISFSGLCYISSVQSGNSGNRGRCSQQCRSKFLTTIAGKDYPLNLKDNSALSNLDELIRAGVDSLKIEGRIKKFDYVYTVVKTWREQIQKHYISQGINSDESALHRVFNRGLSNNFMKDDISKGMFIDNPRDNSAANLAASRMDCHKGDIDYSRDEINKERAMVELNISEQMAKLNIDKKPLRIKVSGQNGSALRIEILSENHIVILSDSLLSVAKGSNTKKSLCRETLMIRLKSINETSYFIDGLNLDDLEPRLTIPFKELTTMKNKIILELNGLKELIPPVELPKLKRNNEQIVERKLSVLISSEKDLHLCDDTDADIYFALPNCIDNKFVYFAELFKNNRKLIPWFPAVLIGKHFNDAVNLLSEIDPTLIVTNNTGIAREAHSRGIAWVAGPYLNIVNSYALLCMKEHFSCVGAFISNELNRNQIGSIKRPQGFRLFYSIYHPIVLMTSRQCLFHQVTGCHKNKIDNTCISNCVKSALITNEQNNKIYIEKSEGNYHRIYNDKNFLNTNIVSDVSNKFTDFFIYLSNIENETQEIDDKTEFVNLFKAHINGDQDAKDLIYEIVPNTKNAQYKKGI